MPHELKSREEFDKLLDQAKEIRIKRADDSAKVKIRTKTGLYTLKVTAEDADSIAKSTKIPVTEY